MSMFQGASQVAITGGIQVAAGAGSTVTINPGGQGGISSSFKDLSASAAHTALHNAAVRFNAPRCHRNTRTTYLDALELWMLGQGVEYADARLIWLNGGAGAGKSAIMQSIVERCVQYGVILGTFFFSRTDPSRNHAEVLIPTLAYQLARAFPAVMDVLGPIIEHDPLIFKASLHTQAHELIIRPLQYLVENGVIEDGSPLRRVFVIDGLDECDDPEKQAHIIHVIATILSDGLGFICFLIASRPELAIIRALQRVQSFKVILTSLTLLDDVEASTDIRQFVEDSFLDILDTHPLRNQIPSGWPKPQSIHGLVLKSSGHFIYAATAMKFISSTDEHPTRALQVVEGLVPSRIGNPFAELDTLYLHILASAKHGSRVLDILRHCILTRLDNSVAAICFIYPNISPEDVALFLSDVQALVSLSPDNNAKMFVLPKHASLSDFFRDANRSHAIYISEREYTTSVLPSYFRLLHTGPQVGTTWLLAAQGHNFLMSEIIQSITFAKDIESLQSLISGCSPKIVWDFYMQSLVHYSRLTTKSRGDSVAELCSYMEAIRDLVAIYADTLYTQQLKIFTQTLMDDLNTLIQTESQYRIMPALIFSSSLSCLTFLAPLLILRFEALQIHWGYSSYFFLLQPSKNSATGVIDPRAYRVIKDLPQYQLSWGSDLAPTLKLVLQHLVGYSWTPEHLHPNPHARWLRRAKPWKHISLGSPKLSSTFYSYLHRLPLPSLDDDLSLWHIALRRMTSTSAPAELLHGRDECFILLKTVICYLHKSEYTSDIAKLARRSLPKAALWFPKLMKKARVKMDIYVRRWEESPERLWEHARSLHINNLD